MEVMDLDSCSKEFADLSADYKELEDVQKHYLQLLDSLESLQGRCKASIKHQRYRMNQIWGNVKSVQKKGEFTAEQKQEVAEMERNIIKRKAQLHEIEQTLPQKNSAYLKIILGDVNVSILNRNDKVRYKDDYEKFKLILNGIALLMSGVNLLVNFRALELAFMFLLVWYYCTLTIRESILKVNGSRIKGWWRTHHFISTVCAGTLLIWPQGVCWQQFRTQFMYFNVYISVVQYLQFRYQKGVLYRLKALGERHDMDITIEGFHSWMFRGLSFLYPFLLIGYLFQAYNAYVLYRLAQHPEATWQIAMLSALFLVLFIGNSVTTLLVVPMQKTREKVKERYRLKSFSWAMRVRSQIRGESKQAAGDAGAGTERRRKEEDKVK